MATNKKTNGPKDHNSKREYILLGDHVVKVLEEKLRIFIELFVRCAGCTRFKTKMVRKVKYEIIIYFSSPIEIIKTTSFFS